MCEYSFVCSNTTAGSGSTCSAVTGGGWSCLRTACHRVVTDLKSVAGIAWFFRAKFRSCSSLGIWWIGIAANINSPKDRGLESVLHKYYEVAPRESQLYLWMSSEFDTILPQLIAHVKHHISTICTFPIFDPKSIKADIDGWLIEVRKMHQFQKLPPNEFAEVNRLLRVLIHLVNERIILQQIISEPLGVLPGAGSKEVCNTVAVHKPVQEKRARGADQNQLEMLEIWYFLNEKHPYASCKVAILLAQRTKLTATQVQNWISNKRRKKYTVVSKELEELLNS